ncbi:Endoglucanase [Pseudidiomarina piscicola]|uniref:Glucanase n=1 Tax=Pseudidiomarina piscicola TaxID=2614830 RepID=A0A6S6WQT5_9GAMM|nr:cellulose synthase complex periplasmic endoglucanase BcsZ [Pseudidiomarina piscicola]CAB0150154.1 Endoglucanase [Pseudidiomarina piscicola]VZT39593.1 Endoglucanase [Pseudomonas aeruginosa]
MKLTQGLQRLLKVAVVLVLAPGCSPEPVLDEPPAKPQALQFQYHYQRLVDDFIDGQGRVIDGADARLITTSEGQSYAMLFALLANDPATFRQLLQWTENNLAAGDLTQQLPAWLWGKQESGDWGVIDTNSASDADIVMAYALLQAGELWHEPRYLALGERMLWQIARYEIAKWQHRHYLLPGYFGFIEPLTNADEEASIKLNLSYYALPMLDYFANRTGDELWQQVYDSGLYLASLHEAGFASDWAILKETGELAENQQAEADYDAIRVYLWWAIAAKHDPLVERQLETFSGVVTSINELGSMPKSTNWRDGSYAGVGPIGFSSAVLPMLEQIAPQLAELERQRIVATDPSKYRQNYYDTMLLLYGVGSDQGCLVFAADGALKPQWEREECVYVGD